jgi:RNA polymerase sigma factor (sigma-70 family)
VHSHAHEHEPSDILAHQLLEARGRFLAYIRRQVSDPELAEDILQDGLLRAVRSAPELRDEDRLVSWFYSILRNAIVDAYRRRDVERRHFAPLGDFEPTLESDDEAERVLCGCFEALVPTLKADYAELISGMELRGESTEVTAQRLGITPNNLKVRRHRARQALRSRLLDTCRACAEHGCLDCTCQKS